MVAATFTSVIGWTLGCLLLGLVLYMVGTRTLSELRIWWARQTGRDHADTAAGRSPSGSQGCCGSPKDSLGSAHGADVSSRSRRSSPRDRNRNRWGRWQAHLDRSVGPATVAQCRSLALRIFQFAMDEGAIDTNPIRKVPPPKRRVDPEEVFGEVKRRALTPKRPGCCWLVSRCSGGITCRPCSAPVCALASWPGCAGAGFMLQGGAGHA